MGRKRNRLPNKLKWYRELAGFTQRDVATLLGFKTSNIVYYWEHDLSRPGLKYVLKLEQILHTLPGELFPDLKDQCREEVIAALQALSRNKNKPYYNGR